MLEPNCGVTQALMLLSAAQTIYTSVVWAACIANLGTI